MPLESHPVARSSIVRVCRPELGRQDRPDIGVGKNSGEPPGIRVGNIEHRSCRGVARGCSDVQRRNKSLHEHVLAADVAPDDDLHYGPGRAEQRQRCYHGEDSDAARGAAS